MGTIIAGDLSKSSEWISVRILKLYLTKFFSTHITDNFIILVFWSWNKQSFLTSPLNFYLRFHENHTEAIKWEESRILNVPHSDRLALRLWRDRRCATWVSFLVATGKTRRTICDANFKSQLVRWMKPSRKIQLKWASHGVVYTKQWERAKRKK